MKHLFRPSHLGIGVGVAFDISVHLNVFSFAFLFFARFFSRRVFVAHRRAYTKSPNAPQRVLALSLSHPPSSALHFHLYHVGYTTEATGDHHVRPLSAEGAAARVEAEQRRKTAAATTDSNAGRAADA